jgi:MFS family permease
VRSARIFATLALANVAYAVSQTLLIPAIPEIERRVHTNPVGATALASAFFVSGAATAGLLGRLGDMFGKQRVVMLQLALFTGGALVCALANTLTFLIVGRVVMGLAATLFPLSASIIRDELRGRWMTEGISLLGAVIGIGAAVGLACGGLVVDNLGYRAIFWVPVVLGALASGGVAFFVPASSIRSPGRVDLLGAVLLAAGLAGPLVAISRTPEWGWGSTKTVLLMAAGLAVLVAFIAHERRHPAPLLDTRMLAHPQVALTNVATFFVGFGMFGTSVIMTQFFQEPVRTGYGFGASATQAGLFLVPGTALMLVTAPLSGRLSARKGPKATLLIGAAVAAVALGGFSFFHRQRAELYLWPTTMYVGIGFALAAMPLLILNAVPPTRRGQATATNQIFRLVGSSVGTQLAATIITASARHTGIPLESGFSRAFMLEALGACAAFVVALAIPGGRPLGQREDASTAVEAVVSASELS